MFAPNTREPQTIPISQFKGGYGSNVQDSRTAKARELKSI
jgi:hypothetical protein